eukprot:SAG11_NODE_4994_length_1698_cov_7.018762_2_plen_194_part_00
MVLQDATYHGAVLNEGPAQRDLEGGGLRSKTQSVFVVTFKLQNVTLWPNAMVGGQQRPRWDVCGFVTVEPYLVQYDAGGSKSIKKDSNRRNVDVQVYECSKTDPENIPDLDRIGCSAFVPRALRATSSVTRPAKHMVCTRVSRTTTCSSAATEWPGWLGRGAHFCAARWTRAQRRSPWSAGAQLWNFGCGTIN